MNNYASLSPTQRNAINHARRTGEVSTRNATWQTLASLIRAGWLKSSMAPEPERLGRGAGSGYVTAGIRYQLTQVARWVLEVNHE